MPFGDNEKIIVPLSIEQQLDLLYRNLKPQIQAMVRRAEVFAVDDLLDLAVELDLAGPPAARDGL